MSDENPKVEQDESQSSSKQAWQEFGHQFQRLGESIAAAFQKSWNDEKNRQWVQEMQVGLKSAVEAMHKAVNEAATSPEGQELRDQAVRTAEKMRDAGEQTAQEMRPHVISALRQISEELQKMVARMEQEDSESNPPQEPKA